MRPDAPNAEHQSSHLRDLQKTILHDIEDSLFLHLVECDALGRLTPLHVLARALSGYMRMGNHKGGRMDSGVCRSAQR